MSVLPFKRSAVLREPRKETWRDRVKRAAAPRQAVRLPEKITIPYIPAPLLIDKLVEYGMPRRHAVLIVKSTHLYWIATRFYFDVIEAESGDPEAKARVDHFRFTQERLRHHEKQELGLDPDRPEPVREGRSQASLIVPRGIDANR